MGEDKKTAPENKGQTLEELSREVGADNDSLAGGEGSHEVLHNDDSIDGVAAVKDIKFERILSGVGIGIVASLFVLGFLFYSTLNVKEELGVVKELSTQLETEFYQAQLDGDEHILVYKLNNGTHSFDPLTNVFADIKSVKEVSPLGSKSSGGYSVSGQANIYDSNGKLVMTLGDPAIAVDDILISPAGDVVVFDTKPANSTAADKWGLRMGLYELNTQTFVLETLVSDALNGIASADYSTHFVEILSFSPDGRYIAYTNEKKLLLYDRTSGASVPIADLDNSTQLPDTGWKLRTPS